MSDHKVEATFHPARDLDGMLDLAVSAARCVKVLTNAGHAVLGGHRFGLMGFALALEGDGSVIVTQAPWEDGAEWIHASIAYPDHTPTYDDLATLHDAVFGPRRTSYQVFARRDRHVNIHEHALHLWGRADGAMVLPDFGAAGMI